MTNAIRSLQAGVEIIPIVHRAISGRPLCCAAALTAALFLLSSGNVQGSPVQNSDPGTLVGPVRVELLSDLNNDGVIDDRDAEVKAAGLRKDATNMDRVHATEYLFVNDTLSNGAWDVEDQDPNRPSGALDDDDTEKLSTACNATSGAVWFDFEGADVGKLGFYTTPACNSEVTFPFVVSAETPFPATLCVRTKGAWESEVDGILTMYSGSADKKQIFAKDSLPLTIVRGLGDPSFHRAAVNYIREKNTLYYTAAPVPRNGDNPNLAPAWWGGFRYTVFLQDCCTLTGINARTLDARNIMQLIGNEACSGLTLVTNASYAYGNETDSHGFFKLHRGKLVHGGKWDRTCSVPFDMAPGAFLQHPSYIGMDANGRISFGANDLPASIVEGSGGFQNNEGMAGAPTIWGQMNLGDETLLVVASGAAARCAGNSSAAFKQLFLKGPPGSSGAVYFIDGNGSVAYALKNPAGRLNVVLSPGDSHAQGVDTGNWLTRLFNGTQHPSIKTYLGITSRRVR